MAHIRVPFSHALMEAAHEFLAIVADKVVRPPSSSALLRSAKGDVPSEPGLYCLYENDAPLYIGETGCLNKRYSDLFQTRNHSFRRKLGARLFSHEAGYIQGTTTRCFVDAHEKRLTAHMEQQIRYVVVPMAFGRKEVEETLVAAHPNLLNSRGRRGGL